jgi:hypothetical protein
MGNVKDLYARQQSSPVLGQSLPAVMQLKIFDLSLYANITEWEKDINKYIKHLQVNNIPNQITCLKDQVCVLYAIER